MIVGDDDQVCMTEAQLGAFNRAHEPKKLCLLRSGHYDVYWRKFDQAASAARDWLAEHLLPQPKPAVGVGVSS
jgi:fermentation-respiration switch protein FrsA (DUF1100 family)